jgi:hypothetical protein
MPCPLSFKLVLSEVSTVIVNLRSYPNNGGREFTLILLPFNACLDVTGGSFAEGHVQVVS